MSTKVELSQAEVARRCGISRQAVQKRVSKGDTLAEILREYSERHGRSLFDAPVAEEPAPTSRSPDPSPESVPAAVWRDGRSAPLAEADKPEVERREKILAVRKKEIELEVQLGNYVPLAEVLATVADIARRVRGEMQKVGPELAEELALLDDPDSIRVAIGVDVDRRLRFLSDEFRIANRQVVAGGGGDDPAAEGDDGDGMGGDVSLDLQ